MKIRVTTHRFAIGIVLLMLLCCFGSIAHAGVTPLEQHFGSTTTPPAGCSHCRLEATQIFVEVTPDLATLEVDVFDPEAVAGGSDFDSSTGPTAFEIFDPSGTKVSGFTCDAAGVCTCDATFTCGALGGSDSSWVNFVSIVDPDDGHWLVTADVSDNGVNGYRVRAHDGDETAGGDEVEVYLQSAFTPGNSNADDNPVVTTYYPYVTAGCFFRQNGYDYDSNNANAGDQSIEVTSRDGGFNFTTENDDLSENGEWASNLIQDFTTDTNAIQYGVWTSTHTINGLTANNRTDNFWGRFDSLDPTLSGDDEIAGGLQNLPLTFRIYAPSDADAAPAKPYLSQQITSTNVPLVNSVTRHTVQVTFTNPSADDVTFDVDDDTNLGSGNDGGDGSNVITVTVPVDAAVTYVAGSAASAAGTIESEPGGAAGDIVWDPGVVAAGETVTLTYSVDIEPTAVARIPITGAPATLDGTDAEFLDETGTLDVYFGALCDLAVSPISGTGSIGDTIFEDSNGNDAFDGGEGLSGVMVTLMGVDGAGNIIDLTTTTDASGGYSFDGLPAGDYTVTVDETTLPANLQGNNTVDPDGGNDSTADVLLGDGETIDDQDFGYLEAADLSLTKTLTNGVSPFVSGQTVEYDIVVSNAGPNTATNVTVVDTPTGLTNVVITNPGVCDDSIGAGNTFPCVISSIANPGSVTITVEAEIQ